MAWAMERTGSGLPVVVSDASLVHEQMIAV
jgi:hypothetical protein